MSLNPYKFASHNQSIALLVYFLYSFDDVARAIVSRVFAIAHNCLTQAPHRAHKDIMKVVLTD